jgi:hypothetical protein
LNKKFIVKAGKLHSQRENSQFSKGKRFRGRCRRTSKFSPLISTAYGLTTPEKIALVQKIEVSQGKRPQVDKSIVVTQNVKNVFEGYSRLPIQVKRRTSRGITHITAESILRAANAEDGARAYQKLLESK